MMRKTKKALEEDVVGETPTITEGTCPRCGAPSPELYPIDPPRGPPDFCGHKFHDAK